MLATLAILGVEVLGLCLQLLYLLSHLFYFLGVFVDLLAVLADNSVLDFESVNEVLFDDTELQPWLVLKDLEDEEWAQHFIFLVFVLVFVFFVAHRRECSLKVDLVLRRWQITEICQGLDPELTSCSLIRIILQGILLADSHDLVSIVLLYVIV
jgi:hypothetical protein